MLIGLTIYFFGYSDISITSVIDFWSAFAEGETPVPIPNTAVKPLVVDGTTLATAWESRTVLLFLSKARRKPLRAF
jgi:hypothetical protein